MKILGIDPGLADTGWAVVEQENKNKRHLLDSGCFKTSAQSKFSERLEKIAKLTNKIIKKHKPDQVAIEDLFFCKNQKTAIKVAQAIGVIKLSCIQNNLEVFNYTPLNIKSSITGYGNAQKNQVEFMIKQILKIKKDIKPDHASDAVAVALTHLFSV